MPSKRRQRLRLNDRELRDYNELKNNFTNMQSVYHTQLNSMIRVNTQLMRMSQVAQTDITRLRTNLRRCRNSLRQRTEERDECMRNLNYYSEIKGRPVKKRRKDK